jgi:hypothetical protein
MSGDYRIPDWFHTTAKTAPQAAKGNQRLLCFSTSCENERRSTLWVPLQKCVKVFRTVTSRAKILGNEILWVELWSDSVRHAAILEPERQTKNVRTQRVRPNGVAATILPHTHESRATQYFLRVRFVLVGQAGSTSLGGAGREYVRGAPSANVCDPASITR